MEQMGSTGLKRGEAVLGGFSETAFPKVVKSSGFYRLDVWNTVVCLHTRLDVCLTKIKSR